MSATHRKGHSCLREDNGGEAYSPVSRLCDSRKTDVDSIHTVKNTHAHAHRCNLLFTRRILYMNNYILYRDAYTYAGPDLWWEGGGRGVEYSPRSFVNIYR